MPAPKLNHRLEAACALIRNGSPVAPAMRKAGYSVLTAKRSTSHKSKTKTKLIAAKQDFINRYMQTAESVGLTPEFTATTLKTVANSEKFTDKISAVKEHHNVILRTMIIEANRNRYLPSSVTVNNQFIIPQEMSEESWKNKSIEVQNESAKNGKNVQISERARTETEKLTLTKLKKMYPFRSTPTVNAKGEPRLKTHSLSGKEFLKIMPESWHRNRSETVRKAWIKRKLDHPVNKPIPERFKALRGGVRD